MKLTQSTYENAASKRLVEQVKSNTQISEELANIAYDFFDTVSESELYCNLAMLNLQHSNKIIGGVEIEGRKKRHYFLDCAVELTYFEALENRTLLMHKTIKIGNNTNALVDTYVGHDHITQSCNNYWLATETFSFANAEDILDIIDNVTHRTLAEHIPNIGLVKAKLENGNGKDINYFYKQWERCSNI